MIKAGSLFYAIVISLIIAIVSSSLILFSYLTRIEFEKLEIGQQLQLNVDSGINLLLATSSSKDENKQIDLYGKGTDSVSLIRKHWGAYEILISHARFKDQEIIKIIQSGSISDSSDRYSIYLADEDKPLALCGKTRLKGTAYLPKAGLKRAYIEGQNFTGDQLLDGVSRQSNKSLNEFNPDVLKHIQDIFSQKCISASDSLIEVSGQLSGDSIFNSFRDKTLVYSSPGTFKISDGSYSGNIVFISDRQIIISGSALLRDVIIAAPKIIIEEHFSGNIQAFGRDSIIVKKEVSLHYPSVLGIVKNKTIQNACIILNEKDSVSGSIFSCKTEKDILKQTGIIVRKEAFVYGDVYSNGYADIQGTIHGSLTCSKIMLSTPSSVYENHLLGAVIDATKLSSHFAGFASTEKGNLRSIIKYLQ